MLFAEAVKYLLSLGHETLAIKLGLANSEALLAALEYPHRSFPSVQIAGTNGKGSTAAMLDGICRAAGIRAGLYTSPHLVSITERIRIDGEEIAPAEFARLTARVREAALRMQGEGGALPTFFEQVTAIALVAFRAANVQLAILETGLGGRLDATTAAGAQIVALTPIALDHQEYLGHTLAEIAGEKAAIIRAGVRAAVVAPHQLPAARAVILERCSEQKIAPRFAATNYQVHDAEKDGRLRVTFHTQQDIYENVCLSLRGRHQLTNTAVAIELSEVLREEGFPITRASVIKGLETARHAGRLELIDGAPSLLFDGAHNPAGAQALRDYLAEFVDAPITLVFGAMGDKDIEEIAAILFPLADKLIMTRPNNPRAAALETLARALPGDISADQIFQTQDTRTAWQIALEQTPPHGLLCVTGSLYLIGEIKKIL